MDDINTVRAIFKGFREHRCLKIVEDVEQFEEYYQMQRTKKGKKVNTQKDETSDQLLIRLFLRFYTNSLLDLDARKMNSKELSENGYDVTPEKIRRAAH